MENAFYLWPQLPQTAEPQLCRPWPLQRRQPAWPPRTCRGTGFSWTPWCWKTNPSPQPHPRPFRPLPGTPKRPAGPGPWCGSPSPDMQFYAPTISLNTYIFFTINSLGSTDLKKCKKNIFISPAIIHLYRFQYIVFVFICDVFVKINIL